MTLFFVVIVEDDIPLSSLHENGHAKQSDHLPLLQGHPDSISPLIPMWESAPTCCWKQQARSAHMC